MAVCALAVLVPWTTLHAQAPEKKRASDPFRALDGELARAVDAHLVLASQPPLRTERATAGENRNAEPQMSSATISFAGGQAPGVATSQRRLLALDLDAAGIFAEEGVPVGLVAVAAVESDFKPRALSPKGARGLWQLMPRTAARFGLRVEENLDERINPARSTRAAARYLRQLYLQFGDWLLALAAYNAGEARVAEAIEQAGTRDFWKLAAGRWLPQETRNYVPAVLAAMQGAPGTVPVAK